MGGLIFLERAACRGRRRTGSVYWPSSRRCGAAAPHPTSFELEYSQDEPNYFSRWDAVVGRKLLSGAAAIFRSRHIE
jgi:hypothetical protein